MDDGLDISHGGALAVDTASLRDVGVRLRGIGWEMDAASDGVCRAEAALADAPEEHKVAGGLRAIRIELDGLGRKTQECASGVALMADAYELVELRAESSLLAAGSERATAVREEIARREAADPRCAKLADELTSAWESHRADDLLGQADRFSGLLGGALPFLMRMMIGGVDRLKGGVVPAGATLQGVADPVRVTPVATTTSVRAPSALAQALNRLPGSSGAQVRIEKYTFPDGTRQFAAYVVGTQSATTGGEEPWDLASNVELYGNERSASYQATLDALAAAGARPGDVVHAFGHSQGGMIIDRLAMASEYAVSTVVTAGSPIEPTLPDDVLSVQLRHTDDPVSALAAGGSPAGTGSPESMVVRREADPAALPHDLWLRAHFVDEYVETAAMVDGSDDVRVEALDALWDELATATHVEATEFRAERTG